MGAASVQQLQEYGGRCGRRARQGSSLPPRLLPSIALFQITYCTFISAKVFFLPFSFSVNSLGPTRSGSIIDTLQVVGNENLMDNNQAKLAEELANRKHLIYTCGPHLLAQVIESMDLESLIPYTLADSNNITAQISTSVGLISPSEGEGAGISKGKATKDARKAEKAQKAA
ncbi:hypothetical protein LUZ63_019849 [Rhynchospora breviuscula]|uniref:Uncharacterized protein n=1 Tax=Rhynchospora breviuscula TaxID=2022672 RepID=A0A9Q0C797_9POAL|nr:hypothetical protein LUZ63_019849 [Rhynchospora breviuscula]